MLALSPAVRYVHEPFNPDARPERLPGLGGHYTYVCAENEAGVEPALRAVVEHRLGPALGRVGRARTVRQVLRSGRDALRAAEGRARGQRALLKDPIAIFSVPWIVERFGADPVVMIRHPAAYVSSIERLGWNYDFGYLLRQPLLMRDRLEAFRADIERMAADREAPFDQAILLWRLVYTVVDQYRGEHPDWTFLRHEDISAQPVEGVAALYRHLGLDFDARIRAAVADATGPANAGELPVERRHDTRRDSRAARRSWTTRLTPAQVARVRDEAGPLADRFYEEDDWRVEPAPTPPADAV